MRNSSLAVANYDLRRVGFALSRALTCALTCGREHNSFGARGRAACMEGIVAA
jgi:hypothetical protein